MTPTRRDFIKQIGFTTASWGGWAMLPSGLLAEQAITSLPRSTPETEGVSSAAVLSFLKEMEDTKHELHSFMMLRHGHVLAEGWWNPYGPDLRHTMYSMSKSFTSTAVGFAVAEGKLTVEDKVVSFFPDDLPEKISDHLAALKVKHLLTMSVGSKVEPTQACVKTENWVRTFLAHEIDKEPGTTFLYNSAATYMCSAIVQKVTGQTVIDYLTPRLFTPLGISGMTWETCPRGINTGGWGLSIQTEGLAKFGQLYLQKGKWKGQQILPAAWVEEATTFKIQQPDPAKPSRPHDQNDWVQGYGYQFWRCQNKAFRGDGAFGQFTIVMPEQDAVVIMTSETKDMQGQLDLVWKHLLPAMKDKALPEDATAATHLEKTLAALALTPPKGQPTSTTAARVSGKTFQLDANDLGLVSVSFAFSNKTGALTFRDANASHVITGGIENWELGETSLPGTPPRLISGGAPKTQAISKTATSATWKNDSTLELTLRYYETPHHDTITFVFDEDKVTVTFVNSLASMAGKTTDSRPVLTGRIRG